MATTQRLDQLMLFEKWQAPPKRTMIVTCARELRKLAARRKDFGVTALDTRKIAKDKGLITGAEQNQRALAWIAAVPKVARLTRTERTRMGMNRNANRIYVL